MIVGYCWLNKKQIVFHCVCPRLRFRMRHRQPRQGQPQQDQVAHARGGGIEVERSPGRKNSVF